jgi:hypothetical protein
LYVVQKALFKSKIRNVCNLWIHLDRRPDLKLTETRIVN